MRVPWSWLTEYCDPGIGAEQVAERLSMTGTQVERIGEIGASSEEGFLVGRVISAEQHPNADRLTVCDVDVGEAESRTIVCGAPNVAAGQTVAVALPGAVMPDGQKLGKAKLRGIASAGMILSEAEMELGADSDGIAVLETDAAPGTGLSAVVPVTERVLDLEITPNRPDCLSVFGVAREVHAISGAPLAPEPWAEAGEVQATGEGEVSEYASVTVEVPELCPRFTARAFTDVRIRPSPLWLKQRLMAAGQRPINNVVDITNYVMLLTGQPLHAFDLDKVPDGALIVRQAAEGEKMRTLDDVERSFDSDAVLVCDRNGPSGIAGIMGGQVSEVAETTTRVLMEVANWNGPNLLATSAKLGLRSEASTRFEKQIHPDLTMRAQIVAARLMVELADARLVPGTIDTDVDAYPSAELHLRQERLMGLLGMAVPPSEVAGYLGRLGFAVGEEASGFRVGVPADRYFDVTREVDLIEEVARVHGIDANLEPTLPSRPPGAGGLEPYQLLLRRAEDLLCDAGLDEAVTWSFVSPDSSQRLGLEGSDGERRAITVHNPLSEEQSVMRRSLLGGLLDAASHNLARGAVAVSLFESGRVYLPEAPPSPSPSGCGVLDGQFAGHRPAPARENHRISAIVAGAFGKPSWRGEPTQADFYLGKGLLELLAGGLRAEIGFGPAQLSFLHPGRAAAVTLDGRTAGWLGELHPRLTAANDLPVSVAFEIDAGALIAASTIGAEIYEDLTSFPAVYEDVAVVVDGSVSADAVAEAIEVGGGELLHGLRVFDVYVGEQIEPGKRSLAVRLEFRASDRTLTDAEVAECRAAIVAALGRLGGVLRG